MSLHWEAFFNSQYIFYNLWFDPIIVIVATQNGNKPKYTVVICGSGTTYPSGAPEFSPRLLVRFVFFLRVFFFLLLKKNVYK